MLDFSERKDLLVILIIGILVVVAIMIFSFILIWSPKDLEEKFIVGKATSANEISDEYKIHMYLSQISNLLTSNNYEELYKYLGSDYIEYSGMDVNKLKEKMEKCNVAGQELILENFETKKLDGYTNIFMVTAASKKDNSSIRITIRETSPRQFTIAFDDIALIQKTMFSKVAENITFEILQVKYTASTISYDVRLTNKNPQSIYINYDNKSGSFLLNYLDDARSENENTLFSQKKEMLSGQVEDITLTYSTKDIEWNTINGITLRDVMLSNERVANIFFEF